MAASAPKIENPKTTASDRAASPQSSAHTTPTFVDNRPQAVAQRQMQELINQSPRQQQAATLQARIAQSPRQQQAAQRITAAPAPGQMKANKTGLPNELKAGVENLSGHSLDDVKVHYNSAKPAELQAHAYAQGTDIHVAPGQEKHLPHEAWHVVQQLEGRVKPTMQLKGKVAVNDDAGLEREADVMGGKALKNGTAKSKKNQPPKSTNDTTVQARFYAPVPEQGQAWNDLLDKINTLHARVPLGNINDINNWIDESENNWEGDGEHSASVVRFNAFVTINGKVRTGLGMLKRERTDADNFDWGDFAPALAILAQLYGARTGPVATGGHAAQTYTYTVGNESVSLSEEVNAHGQTHGNLLTRRGQMRQAFDLYNGAIGEDIAQFS